LLADLTPEDQLPGVHPLYNGEGEELKEERKTFGPDIDMIQEKSAKELLDDLNLEEGEELLASKESSPIRVLPLVLSPVRSERLGTVKESRRTLEKDLDLKRVASHDGDIEGMNVPYMLQVNYTDTKLSHRFVRFEIPAGLSYEDTKRDIKAYLREKR